MKINKLMQLFVLLGAFLGIFGCSDGSGSKSSDSLPVGSWFQHVAMDEEYTTTSYYCYTSSGISQWIEVEEGLGEHYITWYPGTYKVGSGTVSESYTEKVEWSGEDEAPPSDLTGRTREPLGEDEMEYTFGFSYSGSVLTLTLGKESISLVPGANLPAYVASIPCN